MFVTNLILFYVLLTIVLLPVGLILNAMALQAAFRVIRRLDQERPSRTAAPARRSTRLATAR